VYRIVPDSATIAQVAALPVDALDAYAEVLEVLQLMPWNGRPQHEDNPGAQSGAGRSEPARQGRWCT
jgi:hypothetical protein